MSEAEARRAIEAHRDALNARDLAGIRAAMHFPHARLAHGRLQLWLSPDDFPAPFARLDQEGWHHSDFASITPIYVSEDKVHYDLLVSRHREDGSTYLTFRSLWIVTRGEGHWGIQFRSSAAP